MPITINGTTYVTKQELGAELGFSDMKFFKLEKQGIPAVPAHRYGNRRIYTPEQALELAQAATEGRYEGSVIAQGPAVESAKSLAEVLAEAEVKTGA